MGTNAPAGPRRERVRRLAACAAAATLCGLTGWLGSAATQGAAPRGESQEDEFRVFEADLGPAWIDVSAYPPEQQQSYALFSRKCGKCHTLARPINSAMKGGEWTTYVNRMSRKAGSGISPKDGEVVLAFLVFDSNRRARAAGAVDPELLPFLGVSRELTGVPRFPASKQDIRVENGSLRLTLEGDRRLDLSRFIATDAGQKLVKWTGRDPHRGELVIAEVASLGGPRADPGKSDAGASVKKAVAEAVGSETDPKERVELILDWLDETIKREYRKGIGEPSAILADPRGDATEFTRLFVAMARAAGIPARARVGFVARRTSFFFSAWAEVWLGGWVPVDPYLGQLPADPTHIRLAAPQDDALAGWDASRVPGLDRLQLRVVLADTEGKKEGG